MISTIHLPDIKEHIVVTKILTKDKIKKIQKCIYRLEKESIFNRQKKVYYRDLLQNKINEIKIHNEFNFGLYLNRH